MVSEADVGLVKAKYLVIVDVDIKTCMASVYQHYHLIFSVEITSSNTVIDWINESLIRFAQDTSLRVYIALAIFCFLAGDLSALLIPFRTSSDVLWQCW